MCLLVDGLYMNFKVCDFNFCRFIRNKCVSFIFVFEYCRLGFFWRVGYNFDFWFLEVFSRFIVYVLELINDVLYKDIYKMKYKKFYKIYIYVFM